MGITAGKAVPTFDNPVTETKDGTTYIQNFRVPLNGFATASAKERSLSQAIALAANGLPRYGHQFEGNSAAFCEKRTATVISGQEKNIPTQVIVTCTFSTIPVDKADEEMNPLDKRPDITWGTTFESMAIVNCSQRTIDQDIEKQPRGGKEGNFNNVNLFSIGVTNSANEPFDPIPERSIPYPTVTVTQNLARDQWDAKINAKLVGTINKKAFRVDGAIIKAGQALLMDRTAQTMYQGKLSYRAVTTTLLLKLTHDLIIQDRGFTILGIPQPETNTLLPSPVFGGNNETRKATRKIDGEDTPKEQLLDGKGNELDQGEDPIYIHFTIHSTGNFDLLLLPREKQ